MRREGFTLIETIYSTLLFGFIVLTLLNLYPSSFLAVKRGEGTLQADALAQAVLEDLRARPYNTHVFGSGPTPSPTPWIYGEVTYNPVAECFRPPNANTTVNYVVGLRVTVSWNITNQTKSVVHEAYVHNIIR